VRGRILAVKLGMNPNSSSLGGDVTFLLLGATALSLFTPIVAALLRLRRPQVTPAGASAVASVPVTSPEAKPAR
jgi:hypothetical protein